jgi:hypothetical protein
MHLNPGLPMPRWSSSTARVWFIAFVVMVMLCMGALAKPAQANTVTTVNNTNQGEDTSAIQTALDGLNTGTTSSPDELLLNDNGDCFTLSGQGDAIGVAIRNDDDNIIIKGSGSDVACINRAVDPDSGTPGADFAWFQLGGTTTTDTITNIKIAQLDFNGGGDGFRDVADTYIDSFVSVNPSMADYTDVSQYVKNLWLDNLDMSLPEGMCGYTQHLYGFRMTDVQCTDPSKDGFTLAHTKGNQVAAQDVLGGTDIWFDYIHSSRATDTGDDALAIRSCWGVMQSPNECARAGNLTVHEFYGTVDPNADFGAAFYAGGAQDVQVSNSTFSKHATSGFTGSQKNQLGAAMLEWSTDTNHSFSNDNVDIRDSRIWGNSGTDAVNAVWIKDDASLSGINITGNNGDAVYPSNTAAIVYDQSVPRCGIKISSGSPDVVDSDVTVASNTYQPNNATYNKCGFNGS